ncbi:MAG: hypothetical protein ABI162_18675 [Luteolibacter sp.]
MKKLTENHFSFKCPMDWDGMALSDNGRFCSKCQKEVFDLTNCSIDEVIALQRKHGPICGSIRVMQAATVAISLSAAACQNGTSGPAMGKMGTSKENCDYTVSGGDVLSPDQLERLK